MTSLCIVIPGQIVCLLSRRCLIYLNTNFTINKLKSEFCQAEVSYLGHIFGYGRVTPIKSKMQDIIQYPAPTNVKSLHRFWSMVAYYYKFCKNFSDVSLLLTYLLKKKAMFD